MKWVNRSLKVGMVSALMVTLGAAGIAAFAANHEAENDALAVMRARVSLSQAVGIAEQHVQGKASRAEFEDTRQGFAYDVEVVQGDKVFDVRVDADKGVVLSSKLDQHDEEREHDKKD